MVRAGAVLDRVGVRVTGAGGEARALLGAVVGAAASSRLPWGRSGAEGVGEAGATTAWAAGAVVCAVGAGVATGPRIRR